MGWITFQALLTNIMDMIKATNEIFNEMPDNIVPPEFYFTSIYDDLSNVLYPNFDGTFGGFSGFNQKEYVTLIKDDIHEGIFIKFSSEIPLCLDVFIKKHWSDL